MLGTEAIKICGSKTRQGYSWIEKVDTVMYPVYDPPGN